MKGLPAISLRRRAFCGAGLSLLLLPTCEAKSMRVHLNISLFSYLNHPIFDVDMNGTDFMAASERAFYGANAVMVMQTIVLGPQSVSWKLDGPEGMPRNGELVNANNMPVLHELPEGVKWLALHIYDDDTVEIKLSKGSRDELQRERGKKLIAAWESKIGR